MSSYHISERMQELAESTKSTKAIKEEEKFIPCNCVGPQNGEPLCPCAMRNVKIVDGRYVIPEQDLGPVPAAREK